jgi:hypothetical protein
MKKANKEEELTEKILKGLKESYRRLIEFKKSKGTDLIVSRDGKIVRINPNDIKI